MDTDDRLHLRLLVQESFEGTLTPAGAVRLNALLSGDAATRKYYLDYVNMQIILKNLYANEINLELKSESDVVDYLNDALEQLAADEMSAEAAVSEIVRSAPPPRVRVAVQKVAQPPRKISRAALITAITSLAAMLLLATFAYYAPIPVASLEDAMDAQWSRGAFPLEKNSRYLTRQGPMTLEKGTVKFLFNNDARVIVEAPAKLEILSVNEIRLYEGRLFARIPPEASGFTVSTSASRVVDIGTAFGVQVDVSGATSVHVMKGSVALAVGPGKSMQNVQPVVEKNAMRVSYDGASVRPVAYNDTAFIRDISSADGFIWKGEPLNLVDIANGGRGYGKPSPFCMIHPATGQVVYAKTARIDYTLRSNYSPVADLPAIDGVFIPDKTYGPVQVSSEGHLFEACPHTSGGWFMPVLTEAISSGYYVSEDGAVKRRSEVPPVLEGHLYGTPNGRASLTVHSNIGLTFDLDVIHAFVPGTQITGMAALCGLSEAANNRVGSDSDLWILVDGQVRVHYNVKENEGRARRIFVPLAPGDRFLTLMTTDGGDEIHNDWLVIAEPVLLIEERIEDSLRN
jgi:hypothetical protein